jgi:hypothetical protein
MYRKNLTSQYLKANYLAISDLPKYVSLIVETNIAIQKVFGLSFEPHDITLLDICLNNIS